MSAHASGPRPAASQQAAIIDMVTKSVPVQACIRRLANWCLCNGVEILEGNGRLVEAFGRIVKPAYAAFLRDALEVMFVCGFVPWVVSEKDGARFPVVLPLGSFAWNVEIVARASAQAAAAPRSPKRRRAEVYRYRVTMLHGDIEESRVRIFDWRTPRVGSACSPLQEIFEKYVELQETRHLLRSVAAHNSQKHVYFSEQIAVGQLGTTGGLNLLDEFRRYTLTGQHAMQPPHMRMWASSGRRLNSVNDAHMHWIRNEFDDATATHLLPPNMEAHEMQRIEVDDYIVQQDVAFQHTVHAFFDLPFSIANVSVRDKPQQQEHVLSEEQYTNIRSLCNFLQTLAEHTYTEIFAAPRVQVRLRARPRLAMNSADDVKKLFECGVFSNRDTFQLRYMFLQQ